jgi:hypothetical protein
VDEAALRALRAAQRPGLPDAAVAAPIVVGFTAAGRAADTIVIDGMVEPLGASPDNMANALVGDADISLELPPTAEAQSVTQLTALPDADPPPRIAQTSILPVSLLDTQGGGLLQPLVPSVRLTEAPSDAVAEQPRPAAEGQTQIKAWADARLTQGPEESVADPPRLDVEDATTREDVAVPLRINATLDDRDGRGGEVLTISVAGLPPGATLSAGMRLSDGSWRLLPTELDGLVLHPAPNWSGDATIIVEAVSRVPGGGMATTREEVRLTVEAVADTPAVTGVSATGPEDAPITLDFTVALTDQDGSETIAALILHGVPDGAVLSAGTRMADGSWLLTPPDLPGLTLTPPAHFSGTITLNLVSTSEEADGDMTTSAHAVTVSVTAVADAPVAAAADTTGVEDGWIALGGLAASLIDRDGSETLGIAIAGLPAGATLSHGSADDGVWRVPVADLSSLSLLPPPDFAGQIALALEVRSAETANGDVAFTRVPFSVTVAPVVDGAALAASASGAEDTAIPLSVSFGTLADASEAWADSVVVTGVPAGASLNIGEAIGGGAWRVPTADLAAGNVTLLPPANSDTDITLTITAAVIDTAGTMNVLKPVSVSLVVGVDAVADTPLLVAASTTGAEDRWIALGGLSAALVDTDGSETLAVTLSGVPDGASLSAGTALGGGMWSVPAGALMTLAMRPPAHWAGEVTLTVTATATETAGGSRSTSAAFTVTVTPSADDAVIAVSGNGTEDRWIIVHARIATPDIDGSESLGALTTLTGVPAGALLSQGREVAPGQWEVLTTELIAGRVALRAPADSDADITLCIATTVIDRVGGVAETVSLLPELRSRILADGGSGDAQVLFGTASSLGGTWNTTSMGQIDVDGNGTADGSVLRISNPTGGVLVFDISRAGGGQLADTIVVPPGSAMLVYLPVPMPATIITTLVDGASSKTSDTKAMGPHDFNWSDMRQSGGMVDTRAVSGSATISVIVAADAPTVTVANLTGAEDQRIPLAGLGGALTDTDGSETLSFRISGLPPGGSLSAGTRSGDGSWTLSPVELATAAFVPPAHGAGTYALTLTAIAREARDGAPEASRSAGFTVTVDAVADAGTIAIIARGAEDGEITLAAHLATLDGDGSEAWSSTTTVTGVPAGAVLSSGQEVAPGIWAVSTALLRAGGITIRPPADSDADFTLGFSATLTDTANGRSDSRAVSATGVVTVTAVADAPLVAAADIVGMEDQWIPLIGLAASLADTDGSETLSVRIEGVPPGARLSHGTVSGIAWLVPAADLRSLAILGRPDASGTFTLTVVATASEARDGTTATTSAAFIVTVDAVADTPIVRIAPAIGTEDHAIRLILDARTTDSDGSEIIVTFRINNVPDGAVLATTQGALVAEADGSVLVPASQAGSLTITPPRDWHGDFTLQVSSIAAEPNGSMVESAPVALPVAVVALADAPVSVWGGATVAEDAPVPLGIRAALADTDGSEVLSYVVTGVPEGMSLTTGTFAGPGRWSLTFADAASAALIVPADYAGTLSLSLTAVSQEREGGSIATTTVPLPVVIRAEIDTPSVGGVGGTIARWATALGPEDGEIALALNPGLGDRDGSESVTGTVTISGLPAGAVLKYADGTVLTPDQGGSLEIPAARMGDVRIVPPADSDVAFELIVTMTVTDTGGVSEIINGLLTVDPRGVADEATIVVADAKAAGHASASPDDGWIPLRLSAATDDQDGSEAIQFVIRDVPAGFALSAGRNMGGGVWVLEPGEDRHLQIRPPAGFEGVVTIEAEAIVTEREGGVSAWAVPLAIHVAPAPSDPGHSGTGGSANGETGANGGLVPPTVLATLYDGQEDGKLPLEISVTEPKGGTGDLSVVYVVSDLSAGARLTAGFYESRSGRWLVTERQLADLAVIPPDDFAGEITLVVSAVVTDSVGTVAEGGTKAAAIVNAVADTPALGAWPSPGTEDRAVALNLATGTGDRDGSETISSVIISRLPAGARLDGPGITDNGDGTFAIDPGSVGQIRFIPPANAYGNFDLTVSTTVCEASNGETRTESRSITFTVTAEADAPLLSAAPAAGAEDSAIPVAITVALADTDGSEMLSLVISGLPAAAFLSAGVNNGDGSWTLLPGQLAGLTVTPPSNYSGTIAAIVTAYAVERSTGSVATTTTPLPISVSHGVDAPIIVARTTLGGEEDTPIAVRLSAMLRDTDGSETLTVIASGVPLGARFSAGAAQPDGTWLFTAAELPCLTFIAPPHRSGDITIHFTAVATERDGTTASVHAETVFTFTPLTDQVATSIAAAHGQEGAALPLAITAALNDTDGSEEITGVMISGLPSGAILSAGAAQPDGSWLLHASQLAGLVLHPAHGWSGQASLVVEVETRDGEARAAITTITVPITVEAVATAPSVTVAAAAGAEDGTIPLMIAGSLVDADGSETLATITIAGLPPGAHLTAGTPQGDGSWSLTPPQLSGLALVPGLDWSGAAILSVSAVARETATGDEAMTTVTLPLTVIGVSDAPTLIVSDVAGNEGTTIPLALAASLADIDGSEVLSVLVAGVPAGFTLSAGTDLGSGRWSVPPTALATLALATPAGWTGTLPLAITACAQEGASVAETQRSLTVTVNDVAHAPMLSLGAPVSINTVAPAADFVSSVGVAELDGEAITAAIVTITAGQAVGDRITVAGYSLFADGNDLVIGTTGIRILDGGFDAATGTLSLAGAASPLVYTAIIDSMQLVDKDGGTLSPGARRIEISLTDAAGDTTRESLSVLVADTVVDGNGANGTLDGSGQDDVFVGTDASETMRGLAGNDFFLIDAGGGNDMVEAGAGFDTLMLGGGVGPPVAGPATGQAWTLVIDTPGVDTVEGKGTLDFSEPASGRIVFGEGGQIEFSQLERITW